MKLIESNWQPSDRQLRQFGIICVFALPLVAWVWGASWSVIGVLAGIGLTIAIVSLVFPQAVKPLFLGLMIVALPIGMVVGELAMLLIYFGLFLPISLVFRLLGRDPLERKLDRNAKSYWQSKKQPRSAASYYYQS